MRNFIYSYRDKINGAILYHVHPTSKVLRSPWNVHLLSTSCRNPVQYGTQLSSPSVLWYEHSPRYSLSELRPAWYSHRYSFNLQFHGIAPKSLHCSYDSALWEHVRLLSALSMDSFWPTSTPLSTQSSACWNYLLVRRWVASKYLETPQFYDVPTWSEYLVVQHSIASPWLELTATTQHR